MQLVLISLAWALLQTSAPATQVKDLRVENPMLRSPVSLVIDDPGPFSHPTAVYQKFGQWALDNGVKGKFSLVPCLGGAAAVDGSAGEFPGHTQQERLDWFEMIKKLYAPNWSFTPEIATHWFPWDYQHGRLMLDQPVEHIYLDTLPLAEQTSYIAAAMKLWKNVGIEVEGLTTPWGGWKNVARNASDALFKTCGKDFAIYFAEYGEEPTVTYEDKEHHRAAVSLRPLVSGGFDAKRLEQGKCWVPCLHVGYITEPSKWTAIEKMNQEFGDRILWMTGREIGLYYYTKSRLAWTVKPQDQGVTVALSTSWETPFVTVSFAVNGLDLAKLTIAADGKPLTRIAGRGKEFAAQTWFVEQERVYVCLKQLKEATLVLTAGGPK